MGELILIWLVMPVLLLLLCYGFGLSLSLVIRKPMNFTIATVLGFLLIVIFGSVLTMSSITASYAALSIGLISVFGLVTCIIKFRSYLQMNRPSILAGLITYFTFGLPIIAYGNPSWAGWVQLDDTASWFAITERLMAAGQSVPSTVASTYSRVLQVYLGDSAFDYGGVNNGYFHYPVGSFIPFGVISKLTGIEKAWLFQPYLSFTAALVAMLFVLVLRAHIINKVILIVVSTLSVMASIIYSYVMWGGIKEIVIIVPLTLFSFTLFATLKNNLSREFYIYASIGGLALFFIGGVTIIGFALPILFIALLLKMSLKTRIIFSATLVTLGALMVGVTYYLWPGISSFSNFLVPEIRDSGNLSKSLNLAQVMGIWPSKDFRLNPIYQPLTYSIIAIALFFSLLGIFYSWKKGLWAVPSLLISSVAVIGYSYFWGGIWLTGKAIAVASPFFLLSAGIGAHETWMRVNNNRDNVLRKLKLHYLVAILAVIVGLGVLASDSLTYKNVWLAPYSQMDELRTIGRLYAGQGPTLMTEYSVFGARYFLRNLDAEAVSELRVHLIPMRDGNQVPRGFAADIDLFNNATIDYFNLLVLRKSPNASRPPLNYELAWSGVHYEVWKRTTNNPIIQKTLPLGNNLYPGAVPSCKAVSTFLSRRTKGDKIFITPRNKVYVIDFANGNLPTNWQVSTPSNGAVDRVGTGGFSRVFSVDETQDYDLWIAGSFPGRLRLQVDGQQVFSGKSVFEGNPYLTNPLTRMHLSAGNHLLTLIYDNPIFLPGGAVDSRFGPIYLSTQTAGTAKVEKVTSAQIPQLCHRNLDWIAIAK